MLFEMAVSFDDASRFVRTYLHVKLLYKYRQKHIVHTNGKRVNSHFSNIHRWWGGVGGTRQNQNYFDSRENFIQTHYSGLMFHLLLRWNDGELRWTFYHYLSMRACVYESSRAHVCVCTK